MDCNRREFITLSAAAIFGMLSPYGLQESAAMAGSGSASGQEHRRSPKFRDLEKTINNAFIIYNTPDVAPRRFTNAYCALVDASWKAYQSAITSQSKIERKDCFLAAMYSLDWALEAMRQFESTEVRACPTNPFRLKLVHKGRGVLDKYHLMGSTIGVYSQMARESGYLAKPLEKVPMMINGVSNLYVRPYSAVEKGPRKE